MTRQFPGAPAPTLAAVDLHVPAGGCVALLGPSGSGKSTLLRLVAGLDVADAGEVLVDGRSVAGVAPERRGTVLVFQSPRLFPHLSVLDNVAFPLLVAGARRRRAREDAERFLDLVGLAALARRRPSSLSGGQEQRVALARALAARPDVLLLDEPFSALDPAVRTEMHELLAELRAAVEPTILLVTHDRHEAAVVADTVAVLLDGRIAQHGPVAELYTRPVLAGRARLPRWAQRRPGTRGRPGAPLGAGRPGGPGRGPGGRRAGHPRDPSGGPASGVAQRPGRRRRGHRDLQHLAGRPLRRGRRGRRRPVDGVEVDGVVLEAETGPGEPLRPGDRVGVVVPVAHRHVCPGADADGHTRGEVPLERGAGCWATRSGTTPSRGDTAGRAHGAAGRQPCDGSGSRSRRVPLATEPHRLASGGGTMVTHTSHPTTTGKARLIPTVVRGAVGGAVAGVVFGVLTMWYAQSTGMPADMPLQMIATIVQGEEAMAAGTASPVVGLVVHMVLSIAFGIGLALLLLRVRSDAVRALVGLAYGLALYLVNFLVISPIAFPVFRDANQPLEVATHLIFGSVAVLFLLDRRSTHSD